MSGADPPPDLPPLAPPELAELDERLISLYGIVDNLSRRVEYLEELVRRKREAARVMARQQPPPVQEVDGWYRVYDPAECLPADDRWVFVALDDQPYALLRAQLVDKKYWRDYQGQPIVRTVTSWWEDR